MDPIDFHCIEKISSFLFHKRKKEEVWNGWVKDDTILIFLVATNTTHLSGFNKMLIEYQQKEAQASSYSQGAASSLLFTHLQIIQILRAMHQNILVCFVCCLSTQNNSERSDRAVMKGLTLLISFMMSICSNWTI